MTRGLTGQTPTGNFWECPRCRTANPIGPGSAVAIITVGGLFLGGDDAIPKLAGHALSFHSR